MVAMGILNNFQAPGEGWLGAGQGYNYFWA